MITYILSKSRNKTLTRQIQITYCVGRSIYLACLKKKNTLEKNYFTKGTDTLRKGRFMSVTYCEKGHSVIRNPFTCH